MMEFISQLISFGEDGKGVKGNTERNLFRFLLARMRKYTISLKNCNRQLQVKSQPPTLGCTDTTRKCSQFQWITQVKKTERGLHMWSEMGSAKTEQLNKGKRKWSPPEGLAVEWLPKANRDIVSVLNKTSFREANKTRMVGKSAAKLMAEGQPSLCCSFGCRFTM